MIEVFGYDPIDSDLTPIWAQHISDRFVKLHSAAIDYLLDQGSLLVPCQPQNLPPQTPVFYCDIPLNGNNLRKNANRFWRFCSDLRILKDYQAKILLSNLCQTASSERNWLGSIAAFLLRRSGQKVDLTDFVDDSPGG
jgi:hypothetical protein